MIHGQPVVLGGGNFNIAYGETPPDDKSKLWLPFTERPKNVEVVCDTIPRNEDRLIKKNTVLPTPLRHAAAAVGYTNSAIHIFGGYNGQYLDTIYRYDPHNNIMTLRPKRLNKAMYGAAAVSVNNGFEMYIFGGYNGSALDTIQKYYPYDSRSDYEEEITVLGTKLPVALYHASAVECRGKIYILGGRSGSSAKNTIYVFDPATEEIALAGGKLVEATYGAVAVSAYGKIYIIGGYNYKTTIQVYDTTTDECTLADAKLPNGIQYAAAAECVGDFYIFGGQVSGTRTESVILKYDTFTDTLTEMLSALPNSPYGMVAGERSLYLDASIFILGGYDDGYLDTVWKYTPRAYLKTGDLRIYVTAIEGENEPFATEIFKSSGGNVRVRIASVYQGTTEIGKSAQTAYVYNTEAGEWQTLDGVAYSAE